MAAVLFVHLISYLVKLNGRLKMKNKIKTMVKKYITNIYETKCDNCNKIIDEDECLTVKQEKILEYPEEQEFREFHFCDSNCLKNYINKKGFEEYENHELNYIDLAMEDKK